MKTLDEPLTSYKRKKDLEALAGALGLSRDGKIAYLSVQIIAAATHLEDPETRSTIANNLYFRA
ncbi:hypothetical protein M405DRAFT_831225 [Rhizopogon salebrosus TDB-379]|nr:hypothetical protein M405DRAFT_831225 [Rhizopogon salebrosus TDB-379]